MPLFINSYYSGLNFITIVATGRFRVHAVLIAVAHVLLQREVVLRTFVVVLALVAACGFTVATAISLFVAIVVLGVLVLHRTRRQFLKQTRTRHHHVRGNRRHKQRRNLIQTEIKDTHHQRHKGERHRHNARGQRHHKRRQTQAFGDIREIHVHHGSGNHAHRQKRENDASDKAAIHRNAQEHHSGETRAQQEALRHRFVRAKLHHIRENDVAVADGQRQGPVAQTDDQASDGRGKHFLEEWERRQAHAQAEKHLPGDADRDHDHRAETTGDDTDQNTRTDLPGVVTFHQPINRQLQTTDF